MEAGMRLSGIARAAILAVLWPAMVGCRKPPQPPPARAEAPKADNEVAEDITQPPDEDDLQCLLDADHARIRVQFGYRGCFGGSDNDFDLDVGAASSLSGHLWTGVDTNQAIDGVTLTRKQGQLHLRRLVDALVRPDKLGKGWWSTKSFVRVSYWCGKRRAGPYMLETNAPSDAPSSRVHATIAAARDILKSVPSRCGDSS